MLESFHNKQPSEFWALKVTSRNRVQENDFMTISNHGAATTTHLTARKDSWLAF